MLVKNMESDACLVMVTCPNRAEAEQISKTIVTERLAACVNVVGDKSGIRSFYIWENQLQQESEILLLIKTQASQLPQLEKRIQELHSYTVPEFVVLPFIFGGQSYLQWIKNSVDQD